MPVSMGAQVRITDGKLSVVDGPFVETKEMNRRLCDLRAARQGRAVAAAREFMQLHSITCLAGRHLRGSFLCDARASTVRARSMCARAPMRALVNQSAAMMAADINRTIHRTILAVWRIEQPRLLTGLSRMLRDVTLAED